MVTHDYLVPSLREWLTRKQREARRGRAQLKLVERASLWSTRPENRHLPSIGEWATIRLLTRKRDRSESQQQPSCSGAVLPDATRSRLPNLDGQELFLAHTVYQLADLGEPVCEQLHSALPTRF